MKKTAGSLFLTAVSVAALIFFLIRPAGAEIEVQTVKGDTGVEMAIYKSLEIADVPASLIKRYMPVFDYFTDFTGDSIPDIMACGERQTDGQIICKIVDTATKAAVTTMKFLDPGYDLSPRIMVADLNGDGTKEFIACGIKLSDKSAVCQTKTMSGSPFGKGQFTAIPSGIDLSQSFGLRSFGVDVDGNMATPEIAFTYTQASRQQMYVRIINPATGAVISSIALLSPSYEVSLWSANFTDTNDDGKTEVVTCGRNLATGQHVCQIKDAATGVLIKNINVMGKTDYISSQFVSDRLNEFPGDEIFACGWNMSTGQPKCQIRKIDGTLYRNLDILDSSFIP
jgi:hypothetical protein